MLVSSAENRRITRMADVTQAKSPFAKMGARQSSGEGVVRRNGRPKGCFLESPFLLCLLHGFRDLSGVLRANLKRAEKKRTLQRANNFSNVFRIVFRILFRAFQTVFRIDFKFFGGSFVLQTCRPNKNTLLDDRFSARRLRRSFSVL